MLNSDIATFSITCLMLLVHPDAMVPLLPLLAGCCSFTSSFIDALLGLCSWLLAPSWHQHTCACVQIPMDQSSSLQFSVPPTQANPDLFGQLEHERVQSHLQVQELERTNASLRNRIWFLEYTAKSLRDDAMQRAREYQELLDINGTLTAEKDEINIADCRDITEGASLLRSENKRLQDSKDLLVKELRAEIDKWTKGNELLLGEKASLEEMLIRETTQRSQAQSQVKHLEEELAMINAQLALKQDTLSDLMGEIGALEDDLKNAVQVARELQHEVENLRETTTDLLSETTTLKAELAGALHEADALRKANTLLADERAALMAELKSLKGSTCPRSHLNAAQANHHASNAALAQLRTEHQLQAGCLDLCRTALRLANDERALLRGTTERHRASQRVSEDLEDSLVAALAERNAQIAQLQASLGRREAECAELRAPVREHHGRELKATLRERHGRDLKTVLARRGTLPRSEITNVARSGTRNTPAKGQATATATSSLSLVLRSPPTSRPLRPAGSPEYYVNDTPTRPSRSSTASKTATAPLRLPRRISSGTPLMDASSPNRRVSWV